MLPVNPIESGKKHIDYTKYRKLINKKINKLTHNLTIHFKGITNSRVRNTFWGLVKGDKIYNPNDWYVYLAYLYGRLIVFNILLQEKRISKEDFQTVRQWSKYLFNRIIKQEQKISDEFFAKIYLEIPIINKESMLALYEEAIRLFKIELKEFLLDLKIDPYDKIIKFKQFFLNYYNIFISKCTFFGNELGKHEGNKDYGNNLYKIFQLGNNNDRMPPELIENILSILIHIRNAIAHPDRAGIILKSDKKSVIIRDFNNKNEIIFEKAFTFHELWIIYYWIIILDRELVTVALTFAILRRIRELNKRYNKTVKCHVCGKISVYFIYPGRKEIICRKCRRRHLVENLKIL